MGPGPITKIGSFRGQVYLSLWGLYACLSFLKETFLLSISVIEDKEMLL